MNDEGALIDPTISPAMLDAIGDALSIAFIVYDKNDQITYASRNITSYYQVSPEFVTPGTRLRDFLGSIYDLMEQADTRADRNKTPGAREKWIAERISAHWRERSDVVERDLSNRMVKFAKRRLPSGYGICVVSDVTDQRKREEQWRADMERVQLTEEILDNLSTPVFVADQGLSLVAVNKALCNQLATGPEHLLDHKIGSVFAGELATQLQAVAGHVLETGLPSVLQSMGNPDQPFPGVCIQRVGKPGRYFVVANLDPQLQPQVLMATAQPAATPLQAGGDEDHHALLDGEMSPPASSLAGRKVLVVTANHEFEAASLSILARMGIECCSLRSEAEEEAFLMVAVTVGLKVDLVIVDTEMDIRCLEMAGSRGIPTLALDDFQIATELAFRVASGMGEADQFTIDDWEITTREPNRQGGSTGPLQVLVAEDNEVNQIVFSQILDSLGCSYRIVADGEAAVVAWKEMHPSLILMDLTLPRLSGLDACRRIRQIEAGGIFETPIIGVLTLAVDRDELDCMAAGMNETILKPLSPDVIAGVLQRYHIDMASGYAL